ncbi:hypothetical protein FTUN_2714 [Frigoriglobus tundricola]|uniref:Uncharacterized protein n=1 Tax=Frigoriglobus tundricola TaxID=2774151 RepID=A0A6M5YMK8_9BACT|nr:hypothetical protein FTUN_2714 [Frigoriglobus tundricola]
MSECRPWTDPGQPKSSGGAIAGAPDGWHVLTRTLRHFLSPDRPIY